MSNHFDLRQYVCLLIFNSHSLLIACQYLTLLRQIQHFSKFSSSFFFLFFKYTNCRNNMACLSSLFVLPWMVVRFHLHMLIPFKFFFFSILFKLRRCACERHRYGFHFFSFQLPLLFHLYHHFFFTPFSSSSALSSCCCLFIISCASKYSKKTKKNKYKPDCCAYSGYASKIITHFTLSIISNIEATYHSVPCLQFLERLICSFAPCEVETGTMQLVSICFWNIYAVCND